MHVVWNYIVVQSDKFSPSFADIEQLNVAFLHSMFDNPLITWLRVFQTSILRLNLLLQLKFAEIRVHFKSRRFRASVTWFTSVKQGSISPSWICTTKSHFWLHEDRMEVMRLSKAQLSGHHKNDSGQTLAFLLAWNGWITQFSRVLGKLLLHLLAFTLPPPSSTEKSLCPVHFLP